MMKNFTYLFFGLVGAFQCSQFNDYYSTLNAIKSSVDLSEYEPQAIKNFESTRKRVLDKSLKLRSYLMLANYYINKGKKEYKTLSSLESKSDENEIKLKIREGYMKAARNISNFMIEYMDYDSINKYIKSTEGLESFGNYMERVNASVVLEDIEGAITAYYFPELKTDETLPSPESCDPKVKNLQTSRSASEQIEQDHGLKRKADKANLSKNNEGVKSNTGNKFEQEEASSKQTWGDWLLSWF